MEGLVMASDVAGQASNLNFLVSAQASADTPFCCRACGSTRYHPVLSLGSMPLANSLIEPDKLDAPEPRFPLDVVLCRDCSLVQITKTVPPKQLFSNYLYFSSFSVTMVSHARSLVERLVREHKLGPQSLAVEIASNDGYLLRHYKARGIPVLGIEPAANIAAFAQHEYGIPTLVDFFTRELGRALAANGQRADVIHANNVFAHVPDPGGFLEGIQALLKDHGLAVIEVPYIRDLIDHLEFDTVYHEHLSYFSATAVNALARANGLVLADVERIPIHGGSLRLMLKREGAAPASDRVTSLLAEEAGWNVAEPTFYMAFAARVDGLKMQLCNLLRSLKSSSKSIAAYGASAKGSTLLNAFGIGSDLIDFVVDRSTVKQGHYTPGTRLPIMSPSALLEKRPDYVLLLTWNFADEILEQQREFRARGGKFIIPVPAIRVV